MRNRFFTQQIGGLWCVIDKWADESDSIVFSDEDFNTVFDWSHKKNTDEKMAFLKSQL